VSKTLESLVDGVSIKGRATRADPTARRDGPSGPARHGQTGRSASATRQPSLLMGVSDVTGSTNGRQLTGDTEGPSGRADVAARRVGSARVARA